MISKVGRQSRISPDGLVRSLTKEHHYTTVWKLHVHCFCNGKKPFVSIVGMVGVVFDHQGRFVINYMDATLINSKGSLAFHSEHVRLVLRKLSYARLCCHPTSAYRLQTYMGCEIAVCSAVQHWEHRKSEILKNGFPIIRDGFLCVKINIQCYAYHRANCIVP